jgi:hypothetical protein
VRSSLPRNFNPGHRAAHPARRADPDGDSNLVEAGRRLERLSPPDEATVFGDDDCSRDIEFLFEAEEAATIIDRDAQDIDNRLLVAG